MGPCGAVVTINALGKVSMNNVPAEHFLEEDVGQLRIERSNVVGMVLCSQLSEDRAWARSKV